MIYRIITRLSQFIFNTHTHLKCVHSMEFDNCVSVHSINGGEVEGCDNIISNRTTSAIYTNSSSSTMYVVAIGAGKVEIFINQNKLPPCCEKSGLSSYEIAIPPKGNYMINGEIFGWYESCHRILVSGVNGRCSHFFKLN